MSVCVDLQTFHQKYPLLRQKGTPNQKELKSLNTISEAGMKQDLKIKSTLLHMIGSICSVGKPTTELEQNINYDCKDSIIII